MRSFENLDREGPDYTLEARILLWDGVVEMLDRKAPPPPIQEVHDDLAAAPGGAGDDVPLNGEVVLDD
jgi:hypothetical protein